MSHVPARFRRGLQRSAIGRSEANGDGRHPVVHAVAFDRRRDDCRSWRQSSRVSSCCVHSSRWRRSAAVGPRQVPLEADTRGWSQVRPSGLDERGDKAQPSTVQRRRSRAHRDPNRPLAARPDALSRRRQLRTGGARGAVSFGAQLGPCQARFDGLHGTGSTPVHSAETRRKARTQPQQERSQAGRGSSHDRDSSLALTVCVQHRANGGRFERTVASMQPADSSNTLPRAARTRGVGTRCRGTRPSVAGVAHPAARPSRSEAAG
jgi:hypothetical protein